jgi:hypothetical protein
LADRIVRALPSMLPVAILRMNDGTSMCVGQAWAHGASKQYRQRSASVRAAAAVSCGNGRNGSGSRPADTSTLMVG